MKENVLKVLILFSTLHYIMSEGIPSAYLPYELVQWTNKIESLIKIAFVKPPSYTFGDAQCASVRPQQNYVLDKISPELHNIWNDLKAKYEIYLKRHHALNYVIHSNRYRVQNKMDDVRQAFKGLMERIPADGSHFNTKDLCSYALSQLTGDTLKDKIDSMRREIIDENGSDVFSATVARFKPPNTNGCNVTYTDSEFIHSFYSELMSMEVGGYITMVFSYWYLFQYNGKDGCAYSLPKNPEEMITELHGTFEQKMIQYAEKFYPGMTDVFDNRTVCFPKKDYRGINYIELEGLMQAVALPDAGGDCEDIETHGVDWTKYCDPYPNNHHCLGIERPCLGRLWSCESRDSAEVCMDDSLSSRRYKWIAPQKNTVTNSQTCSGENLLQMSWRGRAHNCICLCFDNEPDSMSTHIFNLQSVEADVNENKVVTGVRVLVDHRVVHLQIKQGILGRDWRVEGSAWKEINDISEEIYAHRTGKKLRGETPEVRENVDYHVINFSQQFNIDELRVPANHVLTGVKFHYGEDEHLQIAILTREFNASTGKLTISNDATIVTSQQKPRWPYNSGQFPFKNLGNYKTHNIAGEGSLLFTSSGLKDGDSGQTTVPFFDPRTVESNPATAIGGFGFVWRAGVDEGFSLLSPVLYALDYKTYIKESLDRLKN